MKKIFTILAIVAVSTSAFAQTHDLSVAFADYATGSTITTTSATSWDVVITNEATSPADSIRTTDTLAVYITLDGQFYRAGGNVFAFTFWDRNIPAGGSETYTFGGTTAGSNRNVPVCATAIVIPTATTPIPTPLTGTSGLTAYDRNPSDNQACVTWVVTGVGLAEELKTIANETFIANNQLVIENNSVDFNSSAIINVINISGQVVATENMVIQRGRNTVELDNLSTGLYVVSFQVENKISTTKVMVK